MEALGFVRPGLFCYSDALRDVSSSSALGIPFWRAVYGRRECKISDVSIHHIFDSGCRVVCSWILVVVALGATEWAASSSSTMEEVG